MYIIRIDIPSRRACYYGQSFFIRNQYGDTCAEAPDALQFSSREDALRQARRYLRGNPPWRANTPWPSATAIIVDTQTGEDTATLGTLAAATLAAGPL
jgi:hypothetical protein